jgi:hypothetical protein
MSGFDGVAVVMVVRSTRFWRRAVGAPIDCWLHGLPRSWTDHLAGGRSWQANLWDMLMFQAWLEHEQAT